MRLRCRTCSRGGHNGCPHHEALRSFAKVVSQAVEFGLHAGLRRFVQGDAKRTKIHPLQRYKSSFRCQPVRSVQHPLDYDTRRFTGHSWSFDLSLPRLTTVNIPYLGLAACVAGLLGARDADMGRLVLPVAEHEDVARHRQEFEFASKHGQDTRDALIRCVWAPLCVSACQNACQGCCKPLVVCPGQPCTDRLQGVAVIPSGPCRTSQSVNVQADLGSSAFAKQDTQQGGCEGCRPAPAAQGR
jgi:hypothetical protein